MPIAVSISTHQIRRFRQPRRYECCWNGFDPEWLAWFSHGGIFIASGTGSVIGEQRLPHATYCQVTVEQALDRRHYRSHTIQGNYIGVDIAGDTALANTRWGVVLNLGAMTNIQIGGYFRRGRQRDLG